MTIPLKVVILEDHAGDAELMAHELGRGGFAPDWQRVETEADYLAALAPPPDLILADYSLPQFDAPAALTRLQETGLDIPFIVVSGTVGEDTAVAMMKAGAHDYLMKDKLARLAPAVEREIRDAQTRRERQQAEETLRASEARYRRLFESAKDGILILDAESGMVLDVNPFLVELLGFSHEQFLGKAIWELGVFTDIFANQINFVELQQKGYIRYEDMPLETAAGRRINVEFVSNVYQVNHHRVIQCNVRDITARKQAEAQLAGQLDELRRWHVATLGREGRIIELKREVNALLAQIGQPPRYLSVTKD